ncbi:putative beta-glucosidase [Aureobasidium pullulans]|uniref:beta-glucosidase n=1 Tax=Aureobasidium pullulans TaxID=5580 RepID=A0AB74ILM4_AURPU|nr:putative beta-glucosidase [Aureobasidium pullulans]THW38701.1 putative beta-glucosidase [Aureobasidium pullulans]THX33816.1 putative beta-glucosidase [Aureobasidium pullulans]THX51250.1 putative beta-glucosidase [Aureobasidium pullulans]TIA48679.1 putative beta-glucosidase [Aureobasidium pullulans]
MSGFKSLALLLAAQLANAQGGYPNPPVDGLPFPGTNYPGSEVPYAVAGAKFNQTSPPYYPSPWGTGAGEWAGAYEKARAFVSQLTLAEKVNLTTGVGWESELCVGNTGSIPRLGFKALCLQDSPLGVRFGDFVSAFSAGVTVAATWDRKLAYERGHDMGSEHRDKGVDVMLGPVVGPLGRSPEGGRNWEGFSPDPVLSGVLNAETVKGIQDAGVIACTKHYILNEQEHFRQGGPNISDAVSANVDDITLHELYVWPFADAVRAGTGSVMCSYNQANNSYVCQNSHLLNKVLKAELGFQGFVVSDWAGQHSGVSSALAGLDMTMPGDVSFDSKTSFWGANLTIAVLNGTVPQYRIDDMAVRIVAAWYLVDREDTQLEGGPNFSSWTSRTEGYRHYIAQEGFEKINSHVDVQGNHRDNIREVAAKGTVLLKNKGGLPLKGTEQLVGVFGEDAADNQYGPNGCSDRGCDNGTANFPYLVAPHTAIENEVRSHGKSVESILDSYAYSQIDVLAQRTDEVNGACIVFANADAGEGYIIVDGNQGDRNNLTLWQGGEAVIEHVSSLCKNTIVVLHTVGPVLINDWYEHENITAILWAGVPGQESGNAIVDVLYGKVNPSGKLPFTMGKTRESYGTDLLYEYNNGGAPPQTQFEEGVFIDYRAFDRSGETPVYEFGYGLSYTNFSYSDISVSVNTAAPAYKPNSGFTDAAPIYGTVSNNSADYVFPDDVRRIEYYIYPFLNSTSLRASSGDPYYGSNYSFPAGSSSSAPQPLLPASGASGGNPGLYDVLYTVTATVTNTGAVEGEEVPQLYISLGGPNDPAVVLRQFDKFSIAPGASKTFTAEITRRDVSNWSPELDDWYVSEYPKTVYVGSSSRKLPLKAALPANGATSPGTGNGGSGNGTYTVPPVSVSSSAPGTATLPSSSASKSSSSSKSSSHSTSHSTSKSSSHSSSYSTTKTHGPTSWTTYTMPTGYHSTS